jgi:GINS complex subunit 4
MLADLASRTADEHEHENDNENLAGAFLFPAAKEDEGESEDVIARLFRLWRNERAGPELLPAPTELVQDVLELLSLQTENLAATKAGLRANSTCAAIVDCLQHMDAERIKFVLKSFLRARLAKIERNWASFQPVWNPQGAEALRACLMPAEQDFLDSFTASLLECLNESVLSKLPSELASLQDPDMLGDGATPVALPPSITSHVICRVRRDIGEVVVDPLSRATADLSRGDVFVLQYQVIRDYLRSGDIELV